MAHQRQTRGDDDVTQTLACCGRGGLASRCSFGADFRLCMGWLARQASRLWLGCSKLLCWWPRLLWLRRLLCAATGPDPVGPPLAPCQSLLLNIMAQEKPRLAPGLFTSAQAERRAAFDAISLQIRPHPLLKRKQFPSHGLGSMPTNLAESRRNS